MALASIATAAQIIGSMESSIVPHMANPLKNKVVHADIRVHGIEDDDNASNQDETSTQLVEQPTPTSQDVQEQEHAEEMQRWWNNEMKKHMDQPDGYAKVAVLLIKWADDLDELKTRKETLELEALFRDRFHYDTRLIELNVAKSAQLQLDKHVGDFLYDFDGPHNLLIVYYTGHGLFHDDKKFLEFSACNDPLICRGLITSRDAKANWNKVEDRLRDVAVESDVLTILDTCYASNLVKKSAKPEAKKFELVAASAINEGTAAPGEHSFTRAFIDGVNELLNDHLEPISTFRLVQSINLNKNRDASPAQVWARGQYTDQRILLTPLKKQESDSPKPAKFRSTPGGYLTLKLGLRDAKLNKEQIEYMAKTLSNALLNKALIGLKQVEWMGMEPAPPIHHFDRVALVMYAATQWKKVIRDRKQDRASQLASQTTVDQVAFPDATNVSPTTCQKRIHNDSEGLPDAKRQFLDPAPPPSPPVSNSSQMDYY
ncbi:hypothetical protein ACEQ8H_000873 [Pleosporales sp. CAS-2024a]